MSLAFPILLCLSLAPFQSDAQNIIEPIEVDARENGRVQGDLDWTKRSLVVFGEGVAPREVTNQVQARLLGFRAAKVLAYRNLLEVVGEVQIDGQTTVSMAMVSDDSIRTRVEGIVSGARVLPGSRERVGDVYRIALELDLLGDLADTVLPTPEDNGVSLEDKLPPAALPESDSLLVFFPPEPFTGLIVDARGLNLSPSMSPRIIDTADRVIFGADHVDRDYAVRMGIVGYDKDVNRAATSDRLGGRDANPLIVTAVDVSGLYNSDVVVDRDSGVRVKMADMESGFLSQCQVVFLVGPAPTPRADSLNDALLVDPFDTLFPDGDATGTAGVDDSLDVFADSLDATQSF